MWHDKKRFDFKNFLLKAVSNKSVENQITIGTLTCLVWY